MVYRANWTEERREHERELKRAREAAKRRILNPGLPAYLPKALRGPSDSPLVPNGHELAGISTLRGPDGVERTWEKTRVAGAEPTPLPAGFDLPSRISIMARGDGSEVVRWASYERKVAEEAAIRIAAWEQHAKAYTGIALPQVEPVWADEDLLTAYFLGDPHIGLLAHASETGRNHDLKIAEAELVECFSQLVARSPAAAHGLIIQLGDFKHAEDNHQRTPGHGNKLDVDGRAYRVEEVGHRILRALGDLALQKHKRVTYVNLPGNHDPNTAFSLAAWLRAVYEREPRMHVDNAYAPYFYHEFGQTLIGACHGDGAKENQLPLLMAARQREAWGRTRYHVFHAGHIHHTRLIEHSGCRTWYHNTLAAPDAWHHHSGYDSEQCLEAVTYHREFGQDTTVTVGIERVRQALAQNERSA